MECLLCHFRSDNVSILKDHYHNFHSIDTKDCHFLDLFKPDTLEDNKCFECCSCIIIISVVVQEMTEELD